MMMMIHIDNYHVDSHDNENDEDDDHVDDDYDNQWCRPIPSVWLQGDNDDNAHGNGLHGYHYGNFTLTMKKTIMVTMMMTTMMIMILIIMLIIMLIMLMLDKERV